ncbi:MAG: polysaccharide biosynthesis/export family protein [Ferruginibacter sp.]|nr:polysaccharide biosynthesis/export family protein [Cytophagales bacterium]
MWVLLAGLASCVPNRKFVYLQNKTNALAGGLSTRDSARMESRDYSRKIYRIQINDILSISVRTLNENQMPFFNGAGQGNASVGSMGVGDIFYLNGYTVNDSGQVELPMMGKIKVVQLTLEEAKRQIENGLKQYFNNYFVVIKFGGIRFSVLGEINRPGKYLILQEQLNIFEALANAGDLTVLANRLEVQIVRQFPEGPQIYSVDLTDRTILYSPYYFVQPNDIIYVKPLKIRALGIGTTGFGTFQSILSLLSAVLFAATFIRTFR